MGIIKGDIKRALNWKTVKIGDIEISLNKTTAKEIVEFQEIPIKALGGKDAENLKADDLIGLNQMTTDWFVNYISDKSPETDKSDIELFVAKNKQELQKEFTIGFGLKSRESYEADEKKAKDKLAKKE